MAMTLSWNASANKFFESGVDRGVVYPRQSNGSYTDGEAWEGLISVSEKPGGGEPTDLWANNVKYATLLSAETFAGTIEAYTYPDVFLTFDGFQEGTTGLMLAQQGRVPFGFTYRSYVGNEAEGQMADYLIHVVYGCVVQPSEVSRSTINDSPEAATFSWDFESTPAAVTGFQPTSKIVLDSRTLSATGLAAVEEALYGDGASTPALPLPDDLILLAQTT